MYTDAGDANRGTSTTPQTPPSIEFDTFDEPLEHRTGKEGTWTTECILVQRAIYTRHRGYFFGRSMQGFTSTSTCVRCRRMPSANGSTRRTTTASGKRGKARAGSIPHTEGKGRSVAGSKK